MAFKKSQILMHQFYFRFADFIVKGCWHISSEEVMSHDLFYNPLLPPAPDNISDAGSETESELVFILGNPNMTVRV